MMHRFPVKEAKKIGRSRNHLVIVMQFYPRFIPKDKIDEYLHALAPHRDLFTEFKEQDRLLKDHDKAFEEVRYEERFWLSQEGKDHLERLAQHSKEKDVVLFCQCDLNQKCHADLLLLMAQHWFKARIPTLRVNYARFKERLDKEASDLIR